MTIRPLRLISVLAALCLTVSVWATHAAPTHAAATQGRQALLLIDRRVTARALPSPSSRVVGAVEERTPLTGVRTALPILQTARGPSGGRWLRVRLPMRPNGVSGWVPAYTGKTRATDWRIVVHRSARRATVYEGTKVRARYSVIVGQSATPTPLGNFFIVEKIHVAPGVTEGPWALATSAYSNVLTEFAGGPGQVALHGIVGLRAPLGTFSSHGCIRFGNDAITFIASHVDNGTPVDIQP